MLTICLDYLNRRKRRAREGGREREERCFQTGPERSSTAPGRSKQKAAISRFSVDDQIGPEQQMEEQKAVMVCDISLFSAVTGWFFKFFSFT